MFCCHSFIKSNIIDHIKSKLLGFYQTNTNKSKELLQSYLYCTVNNQSYELVTFQIIVIKVASVGGADHLHFEVI